ncbi:hypothetical protein LCGC14_1454980 [marine sediment metagenome]|uniref:Uncharacterized protein n=1 Tax=marine sediment metagenome TaxID=412755 RepID=A0A0F9LXC6_9ZZZZ
MNWETIKQIYYCVLIRKHKIEYLGGDKYRLIAYYKNGRKYWSGEYNGLVPHGRCIFYLENGKKDLIDEYENGTLIN